MDFILGLFWIFVKGQTLDFVVLLTLILHSVEAADHFIKVGDEGRGRKADEKYQGRAF